MATRLHTLPLPIPQRSGGARLRFAMLFLACAVFADSLFGASGFTERRRAQRSYAAAAQELQAVRKENAGLREQVRRLQSDPETIESVAREDLGLIRPGEILFVIRGPVP